MQVGTLSQARRQSGTLLQVSHETGRMRLITELPTKITQYLFRMPRPSKRQLAGRLTWNKKNSESQTECTDYGSLPMEEKIKIISVITLSYMSRFLSTIIFLISEQIWKTMKLGFPFTHESANDYVQTQTRNLCAPQVDHKGAPNFSIFLPYFC